MISHSDIEKQYIDLYSQIRNYFWDYEFVEVLANMEDTVFDRFPNMRKLRNLLNILYSKSRETRKHDKELNDSFNSFKQMIESNDCDYSYAVVNVKDR